MMKMHHAIRLAEQQCGPCAMATCHRWSFIGGMLLFLLALLVLLVGMTSCETGTPLRNGGDARRALQMVGAEAHALIETAEISGVVTFTAAEDGVAVALQLRYTDGTAAATPDHAYHLHTTASEERSMHKQSSPPTAFPGFKLTGSLCLQSRLRDDRCLQLRGWALRSLLSGGVGVPTPVNIDGEKNREKKQQPFWF